MVAEADQCYYLRIKWMSIAHPDHVEINSDGLLSMLMIIRGSRIGE